MTRSVRWGSSRAGRAAAAFLHPLVDQRHVRTRRYAQLRDTAVVLRSGAERLTLARIAGVTQRHARGGPLTGAQEAAALEEIAEVAEARADLLAEHAALVLGWHEHDMNEPL
jgi:hypothetical protein